MTRKVSFTLFLIFIVVPLVELAILIRIGMYIGFWRTVAIIIITGLVGAYLAREQGVWVIQAIQNDVASGIFPADHLFDGALILAGAVMLITPGILTDLAGILCLIPISRGPFKKVIKNYIERKIDSSGIG
ncbi:MAG: FxsA family protein [Candidatus Cloacimonadia bacterium]